MEQGNIDDMFSQMLGELDDLTQQLEDVPPTAPSAALPGTGWKPHPPPATKPTSQEDVDLSSMLDDLCTFENNLVNTDTTDGGLTSTNSVSQDSGVGFRTDSLPRNTYLAVDDGHQKFDTLKRSGAKSGGFATSAYEEYGDDDLSLDALSKDLDVEQKQNKSQALTEEELSTLSPVLHELDDIVQNLSALGTTETKSVSLSKQPDYNNRVEETKLNIASVQNQLESSKEEKLVNSDPLKKVASRPPPPPISKKPKVSFKSKGNISNHPKPSTVTCGEIGNNATAFEEGCKNQRNLGEHLLSQKITEKAQTIEACVDEESVHNEVANNIEDVTRCEMPTNHAFSSLHRETRNGSLKSFESDSSSVTSSKTDESLEMSAIEKFESRLKTLETMDENLMSAEEREERIKSEKMRIALEKMKEARIQKLVVKVYNKDESSKTLMIDERMAVRGVMKQLIEKNHFDYSPNWALIEELPSLYMERMYEEHEKPCDFMSYWTRDTTNQLRFVERKDKYALFKNPQHYLLSHSDNQDQMQERQKQTLLEEFFSGKGPSSGVPEVEGFLHIKGEGKSWNRKYCVLRSSGLYASKSGEPKKGKKLSDLTCVIMFDQCMLYLGRGWKKKFKSPYEYGFALKHPAIQVKSKHIRYLCCEDFKSLMRWSVGIRLAKYGRQLLDNYEKTNEEVRSTSNVSSPFAFRQQQQQQQQQQQPPDNLSLRSADSSGSGSRSNTLPRGVGVKNIFEGAWQRANKEEHGDSLEASPASSNISRGKSVWKPNVKKSNNWWDLQQEEQEERGEDTAVPTQMVRRYSEASETISVPVPALSVLPPPPPSSLNKPNTYKEVEYDTDLPPPPMPGMDSSFPAHPPPPPDDSFDAPPPPPLSSKYSPAHQQMPPPPPIKPIPSGPPKVPAKPSNTFMSYDDLPPPPPPAPTTQTSYPAPPPKPGPKPQAKHPPPVATKRMPIPPHFNYSNNNNKLKPCESRESLEEDPPSFHPPPPMKSPVHHFERNKSAGNDFSSPLNHYYESPTTQDHVQPNTYTIDDFPPPPPFIYDLKHSFEAVGNQNTVQEKKPIQDLPPPKPHSLLSYIKRKSHSKSDNEKVKKRPPPPQRNAATRLSSKRD